MSIFMFFLAVLPAALLMYFVYKADKIEKEPTGLLVKLFLFGLLSTLSALILEIVGEILLSIIFPSDSIISTALMMFCVVALSEEAGKYFVVKKVAWKDPAFNYTFDAVVYAVFSSLGFAALENVMYLTDAALITAIMRGILAVPGHAIDAVFMGSYFGAAKRCEAIGDEKGKKSNLTKALVVPVIIHGFYDFCLSVDIPYAMVIFFIFEIFITIYAIYKVKKLSSTDSAIFPMGYYPGAQVAYQMYNQGALRFDPMTGQPVYVAQPQPMMQQVGFDPMTGQPLMQPQMPYQQPQFQAQPQFQGQGQFQNQAQFQGQGQFQNQAPAQQMGYDPMTGQPIMQQAQPAMQFDPMTGQPVAQQAQAQAQFQSEPQFQAQESVQQASAQAQPVMHFDPMTGQPISQAEAQAQTQAPVQTEAQVQQAQAPIQQAPQSQAAMHFDPMTGQPISQAEAQAQAPVQTEAQVQQAQAPVQQTAPQSQAAMHFDPMTGQPISQLEAQTQTPVQTEAQVQQAQAPVQQPAPQSQPVMHFDPMTGQPISQPETQEQAPVQTEIQSQTVLQDSVPVQDQVFESENPTEELAPNVVSSANYDPMTGRPIEPVFTPEA